MSAGLFKKMRFFGSDPNNKGAFVEGFGTKAMQKLPFTDYKKPVGNRYHYNFIKCRLHSMQIKLNDSHDPRTGTRVKLRMLLAEL